MGWLTCTRREFVAGAVGVISAPYVIPGSARGGEGSSAGEEIAVGVIGLGNAGAGHLGRLVERRGVRVVGVCDVDAGRAAAAKGRVEAGYGRRTAGGVYAGCASYGDYRELLARKDIDAALVAAPDHWHALIAVEAMRAGKDVYCEKPLTRTIHEGRVIADTAKRYGRVLQTGSQRRSEARYRSVCELVRNEKIGRLERILVGVPGQGAEVLPVQGERVPEGFDYERWLGPAPFEPYHRMRCHYFFRFLREYSGGPVTNAGAHDIDLAQWAMGMDESGPVEVEGRGEFPRDGFYTTAMRVDFTARYASGVTLRVRTGESGVRFEGTEGWVEVSRGEIRGEPGGLLTAKRGANEVRLDESDDHWGNFLECVRSRRAPICPAEAGHRSATVCHLGNLAMMLGRKLRWDPGRERFVNDDEANGMLHRAYRAPWVL